MKEIFTKDCCLRQFVLSLLVMVSSFSYAYDFEVDGLYYNIIASDQAEVTYRSYQDGSYTGNLQTPETVTFDGVLYHVTSIGRYAFFGCSGLTGALTIPSSVTTIGDSAFSGCSGLTGALTIPSSVTTIGDSAFSGCSGLTGALTISNSVTTIGSSAFYECSGLTGNLTIPNSVTSIGDYAFYYCSGFSGSLTIPNSLTTIGKFAFSNCRGLSSLAIPNSVITIEDFAFNYCTGLTGTLTIPNSVKTIGTCAFRACSFTGSLIIPNSVTLIGTEAFANNYNLTSLSIPNSVTSIEDMAFWSCFTIEHVYSNITSPFPIEKRTFELYSSIAILHIPKGTKDAYNSFYNWICNFSKVLEESEEYISTYTLSISASGYGTASYNGTTIRDKTQSVTVNEGTKAAITFTPDAGYRIKSLKVDGSAKTATTSYEITVNADTSVEVEFEAIPPTTYTLSIKATGNGTASYDGTTIRGKTQTFTVNEGTKATITFTPDNGYRIKSLKVNGSSKTVSTSYDVMVNADTSVEVEFEVIPEDPTPTPTPTTYTLSIKAVGNGSAYYGGEVIKESSRTYSINEGSSVSISFTPDEGYRIESVKVNGSNIGKERSYSTTINANTTVEVVFEAIPVTTYTLTVTASGNGIATFNGTEVRDGSHSFTVNEGSDAIISFTPDKGYKVDAVKADGNEVEVSESYTISNITSDKTLEVAFAEMDRNFSIDGVGYQIESFEDNSVTLTRVQNSITLEVSDKISYQAQDWNIIGITENALENSEDMAAIVWNPEIPFTAKVANPNLLLYVKDEAYAPAGIRNVVVNGFAKAITLTDAQSGNNFYCPSSFTTQSIIYTHNYSMKTGLNESKGWETIALPFDVQQISHSSKGDIVPFAKWTSEDATKPFWLFELTGYGFIEADGIKANTPYIISMPNNDIYPSDYQLSGRVTFSALNAEVKKSDDIQTATFGNNTFVPAFTNYNAEFGYYVLNVNNDFETYQGSANVGSKFILNLRRIHPFEAYMTSTSGTRSIEIFDGMTTSIRDVLDITDSQKTQKVYDLSGRLIMTGTSLESIRQELPAGVYIINNKKMIIK